MLISFSHHTLRKVVNPVQPFGGVLYCELLELRPTVHSEEGLEKFQIETICAGELTDSAF